MPNTSQFSDLFKIILSIRDDPVGPVRHQGQSAEPDEVEEDVIIC